jgi:hypothetical protein
MFIFTRDWHGRKVLGRPVRQAKTHSKLRDDDDNNETRRDEIAGERERRGDGGSEGGDLFSIAFCPIE